MNRDSETIWERFAERAERQKRGKVMEGLLEITFQPLLDNIEIGTVLGSILGGLGLHFGKILGPKAFQERFGKHDEKDTKTRWTKKVSKLTTGDFGTPPPPSLPPPEPSPRFRLKKGCRQKWW